MGRLIALISALSALSSPAFAHEGHHDLPGTVQAQHGGTVKAGHDLYIELVQQGKTLMVYPMTQDLKPIPLKELTIEATATLPRGKGKSAVKMKEHVLTDPTQSHFMGSYDAKGSHRYTLDVTLKYKGKTEKATFQVEPNS